MDPFFVLTVSAGIISVSLPAAFYAGIRVGTSHAEADQVWFRSELRQANDRLFAVSREPGAVIPPRIEEPRPPIELSDKLEAYVSDWESADVQEALRRQFCGMLEEGVSPDEILRRQLES